MKKLLFTIFLIVGLLSLTACEPQSGITVSGGTDNTITVDTERTEMKQVNGITYFRSINGIGDICLALDPSTLYLDTWQLLQDADLDRVTPYTNEELTECGN